MNTIRTLKDKTKELEVIWCMLNVMIEPIDIMRFIERLVGRKAVLRRWGEFFDRSDNTETAIREEVSELIKSAEALRKAYAKNKKALVKQTIKGFGL